MDWSIQLKAAAPKDHKAANAINQMRVLVQQRLGILEEMESAEEQAINARKKKYQASLQKDYGSADVAAAIWEEGLLDLQRRQQSNKKFGQKTVL